MVTCTCDSDCETCCSADTIESSDSEWEPDSEEEETDTDDDSGPDEITDEELQDLALDIIDVLRDLGHSYRLE